MSVIFRDFYQSDLIFLHFADQIFFYSSIMPRDESPVPEEEEEEEYSVEKVVSVFELIYNRFVRKSIH